MSADWIIGFYNTFEIDTIKLFRVDGNILWKDALKRICDKLFDSHRSFRNKIITQIYNCNSINEMEYLFSDSVCVFTIRRFDQIEDY